MNISWSKISNYSERMPHEAVAQQAEAHNQFYRARATGNGSRRRSAATAMGSAAALVGVGLVLLLALLGGCAPSGSICRSIDAEADCDGDLVKNADDEFDFDPARSCTVIASGTEANFASKTADCDNDGVPNNHDTPAMADVDDDNDGLIDIYFLDDLHNIRNNLEGASLDSVADTMSSTGVVTAGDANAAEKGSTAGAPTIATADCTTSSGTNADGEMIYLCGYELMRSLDFDVQDSYASATSFDTDNKGWRANNADPATATNVGWLPLAHDVDSVTSGGQGTKFSAILEGNGNTITNLYINRVGESSVGLVGIVASEGAIRNLGLVDVFVVGNQDVGGLVGSNSSGTINTSYSTGSVMGTAIIGGLVGFNRSGTISTSYSTANILSISDLAGGLVGNNDRGTISTSYSTGSVMGDSDIGGLVGQNSGTISASHSTGSVTARVDNIGGLVGYNSGTISAS